jgi:hypothetical protein
MSASSRFAPSKLPSLGLVVVVLVHAGFVGFLVWGFTQPPLDRVWELSQALKVGKFGTLAQRDRDLLLTTLARHPGLTESLLSEREVGIISANTRGWLETRDASVLVSAQARPPCSMRVATRPAPPAFPVSFEVSGSGWRRALVVRDAGGAEMTLPDSRRVADVVEVRFTGNDSAVDAVYLDVSCDKEKGEPR